MNDCKPNEELNDSFEWDPVNEESTGEFQVRIRTIWEILNDKHSFLVDEKS
jgi:hypothetical protein